MSASEQQGNAPAGWYAHPQTGQPAWWTGVGWTAAPPPPPPPPAPRLPEPVPAAAAPAWSPRAASAGGGVNQFGFPAASGSASYGAPTRYAGSTQPAGSGVRRSGGAASNLGTWLVVGVVAIVLVGGGLLVFRGLGKTAQAEVDTGQQGITQAHDADVKQALINASQAMETWFTDHQNFAVKGPVVGLSATAHVQVWATDSGYCLRAYSLKGAAQGPANGTYWWYDSQGGGLQPQPSGAPSSAVPGAICPTATSFKTLN
jgi:hypothetical protein